MAEGGGGGDGEGGSDDGGGLNMINGLLCSILQASTRSAPTDLAGVIERKVPKEEIKKAWHQLFTFFKDVEDKAQKKCVIDITRSSIGVMIDDILKQLSVYDRSAPDSVRFVFPWDYTVNELETENEYRSKLWEQEKSKENNLKFEALEHKIEKKHNELVSSLEKWSASIVSIINKGGPVPCPTYANAATGRLPAGDRNSGAGRQAGGHLAPPLVGHETGARSRSASKRRRNSDGTATEVLQEEHHERASQPIHPLVKKDPRKKPVTGTSDSNATGRKMKSPPADIFVWGVHKATTIEDIVNDLAESDIKIEPKDVLLRSKPEANLCSYKISVPATDLAKALDPSIWPLRVRVREYIYYSNKPKKQQEQQASVPRQQQQRQDNFSIPTFSRFTALGGQNVPDLYL